MFSGAMTALVTPFREGKVDWETMGKLIEFQIENGVAAIVPCGTTGESATLSHDEHDQVVEFVVEKVGGRVKVIAGAGSNNTAEAVRLTRHARETGADAALVITPYYNKPTQAGLIKHFETLAEVGIPLVLYNVPGRTGVSMAPDTVALLSRIENIVAIKEASGSLEQVNQILNLCEITVISGDDMLTLPILSVGGRGVISVAANVVPDGVSALVGSALAGDWKKARAEHFRLYNLFKAMFYETNPIPAKTSLAMMGRIKEEFRLPMCEISEANRKKLSDLLKSYGLVS